MNRIDQVFENLKNKKQTALMPFLVAGHPNFQTSLKLLQTISTHADLIEIGFPYSDPLADGPVIQRADQIALKSGITTDYVFKLIKQFRKTSQIPITVLVYANLIYQRGIERFYTDSAKAGIDGVLVPDLPFEESERFVAMARKFNVANICLIAPTTDRSRLKKILPIADSYIYLTSVVGITGARKDIPSATLNFLRSLKKQTKLPIAVGVGISNHQLNSSSRKPRAN